MLEPDRSILDRIATELAETGGLDEPLVQDLMAGVPGTDAGDLEANVAADVAMSVLRTASALPQPSEEEAAGFPAGGEIKRLRTLLSEARQDPRNIENATTRDLLKALFGPRPRRSDQTGEPGGVR